MKTVIQYILNLSETILYWQLNLKWKKGLCNFYVLYHKKCRIYSNFNFLKYHRNTHSVSLTTFLQCKVSNANIYFYNTKQAYKYSKTENYIHVFIILDIRFCFQLRYLALRKPANVYFGVVGCDVPTFTGKNVLSPPEPNFITVGQSYRYQCIPGYIARGQEHTCTKPGKFEPEQPNVKCCRYNKLYSPKKLRIILTDFIRCAYM